MRKKQAISYFFLLCTLLLTNACASIFSGRSQDLHVASNPPGAKIFLNQKYVGETPQTVRIQRNLRDYKLTLEKPGYQALDAHVQSRFNPVAVANILFPLGWFIDLATGALLRYDDTASYDLRQTPASVAAEKPKGKPLS